MILLFITTPDRASTPPTPPAASRARACAPTRGRSLEAAARRCDVSPMVETLLCLGGSPEGAPAAVRSAAYWTLSRPLHRREPATRVESSDLALCGRAVGARGARGGRRCRFISPSARAHSRTTGSCADDEA